MKKMLTTTALIAAFMLAFSLPAYADADGNATEVKPVDPVEPAARPKLPDELTFMEIADKTQAELDAENVRYDDIMIAFARREFGITGDGVRRKLALIVTRLQLKLADARTAKGPENPPTTAERVRTAYEYIFGNIRFNYRKDFTDLSLVSINRMFENFEGNSLGLGMYALAVLERLSAERIDELAAAWTGDHVVLCYRERRDMRFLEPDERGLDRTWKSYGIPEDAVKTGAYLTPLDKEEVLGLLLYARGRIYYREKKYNNATEYLELAVKRFPRLLEAHMLLAKIRMLDRKPESYRKARIELDAVCRLNPRNSKAFLLRGKAHYFINDLGRATDDFKAALKFDRDNVEAYYYLGLIAKKAGDFEKARASFSDFMKKTGTAFSALREKTAGIIAELDARAPVKVLSDRAASYRRRIAAVKELGRLKVDASIPPLIEAMGDDNIRFRHLCARTLRSITGESFGADQTAWRTWYNSRK